jgi:hypothetical protein
MLLRIVKNICMFVVHNKTNVNTRSFLKVKKGNRAGHAVKFRNLQNRRVTFGLLCSDLPSFLNLKVNVMHNNLVNLLEESGGADRHRKNLLELLKTYALYAEERGGIDTDVVTSVDWLGHILDAIESAKPLNLKPCNS